MSKIKLIPFRAKHIKAEDMRDEDRELFGKVGNMKDALFEFEESHTGFTLMKDGVFITALGYTSFWKGVCEIWSIPSKHISKYTKLYMNTITILLYKLIKKGDFHRVQAKSVKNKRNRRFFSWLGFSLESTLVKYSIDKKDYDVWSILI